MPMMKAIPEAYWILASLFAALLVASFTGYVLDHRQGAGTRNPGIRNLNSLIEGHGGMLDGLDSLCFSAPVFFHLTRYYFST